MKIILKTVKSYVVRSLYPKVQQIHRGGDCGTISSVVASGIRGLGFESSLWQLIENI